LLLLTSRFTEATVCSAVLPFSACCCFSSVILMTPPLIPLRVVLVAVSLAPTTSGGSADRPPSLPVL
jgi:hypothetical protein